MKIIQSSYFKIFFILLFSPLFMVDHSSAQDTNYEEAIKNEFKVNPTFFAASTDSERCKAIIWWEGSIHYYSKSNPGRDGKAIYWSGEAILETQADVPAFRDIFGKSYSELSKNEHKKIRSFVKKCSKDPDLAKYVEDGFVDNVWIAKRFDEFEKYNGPKYFAKQWKEIRAEKEAKELNARTCRRWDTVTKSSQVKGDAYEDGELILKTNLFRIYFLNSAKSSEEDYYSCPCNYIRAFVIFNVNENYKFQNDSGFWSLFETEMLPAIKERCPNFKELDIMKFQVQDYYLWGQNKFLGYISYSINEDGRTSRTWYFPQASIAERKKYDNDLAEKRKKADELENERLARQAALQEAEKLRQEAENKRLAELRTKSRIESQRKTESKILQLYKRGAAEKYDFSGYQEQTLLNNIYTGSFEPFTGGIETYEDYRATILNGAGSSLSQLTVDPGKALSTYFSTLAEGTNIQLRRDVIRNAYYAYHNIYKDQCSSNKELSWVPSTPKKWEKITTVTTKNGFGTTLSTNSTTSEKTGIQIPVRLPFLITYDFVYKELGNFDNVSPSISQSLTNDFRKFLQNEGCSSSAVRHFEINLDLAASWNFPLQNLLTEDERKALPKPTNKPVVEVKKQTPSTTKPKPKTRPKN